MSDRNQQILRQLVINQKISEDELMKKFDLTARQLEYSIETINDRLQEKDLPAIEKKQGKYISHKELSHFLAKHQTIEDVLFSADDRVYLIIIMILTRTEELSLNHFVFDLGISKNTAVSDIKRTKTFLEPYQLAIEFSRKDGYSIKGTEWNKRRALSQSILRIYRNYGNKITSEVMESSGEYIDAVKDFVQQIEKYLNVKYNDENYYPLIFLLATVFIRIRRGHLIEGDHFSEPQDVEGTQEFQSLQLLPHDLPELPHYEKLYMALQLLSANVQSRGIISDENLPLLSNSLWEFLNEFENKTFLVIADKKGLLKKLLNHFKPAYYRIKYDLSIENVLYERILDEYNVLHDFVKQSIGPLESFFDTEISDQEVAYITLFVGGHMISNEPTEFEDKITKAVIVCPNGISMSKLIEKKLKETFPEFLFYPASSIREYKKFILPHNLVFSTVPLDADKKVFVIDEILSSNQQVKLRTRVIKEVYNIDFAVIQSEDILNLVKQYADVKDERKLLEDLDKLLLKDLVTSETIEPKITQSEVNQLITEDFVTILEEKMDWEAAFRLGMQPLLENEVVTEAFQDKVLAEYEKQPEYILVRQAILLPHLDPTLTEQKLGVSIVIDKAGIKYADKEVNVLMILTTPDKTSHLNLLYGINRIAKKGEAIDQLLQMESKQEIVAFLQNNF